jgi:hypothetical protein
MATKKMTLSMPEELYKRLRLFSKANWSALCRKAIEQELRIREAMADSDRIAALREKARADYVDVRATGLDDALHYPIEEIDYRFLREFEVRGRDYLEGCDHESLIGVLDQLNRSFHEDGSSAFRLRFPESWEYKLGFIEGITRLKRIADGFDVSEDSSVSSIKSLFDSDANTLSKN